MKESCLYFIYEKDGRLNKVFFGGTIQNKKKKSLFRANQNIGRTNKETREYILHSKTSGQQKVQFVRVRDSSSSQHYNTIIVNCIRRNSR